MELSDRNYAFLMTNRARCALNKEISTRKVFQEKAVVEPVYNFDEKSYRGCESIAKVRLSKVTYTYMDTNTDHFTRSHCACGIITANSVNQPSLAF